MEIRAALLGLAVCATLPAIEPRKSAGDYPAHAESAAVAVGADYQVHSFSADGQMYFTKDYLVFEVGVFPKTRMELTGTSFELRINKSKAPLEETSAEFVAASLKYPNWTQHPQLELGAGMGNAGVTLGAPTPVERYPGDPSARSPYPPPIRAPEDPQQAEIRKPPQDPAQLALSTALRTGEVRNPIAGNVYFEYSGNIKKVKSLSLILRSPAGDLEVPIR